MQLLFDSFSFSRFCFNNFCSYLYYLFLLFNLRLVSSSSNSLKWKLRWLVFYIYSFCLVVIIFIQFHILYFLISKVGEFLSNIFLLLVLILLTLIREHTLYNLSPFKCIVFFVVVVYPGECVMCIWKECELHYCSIDR